MLRVLVSAGGTGGGVYPALAVVAALDEKAHVMWVGSEQGMEADLVQRAGLQFEAIPAAGIRGIGLRHLPSNAARLLSGAAAARSVLKKFSPDVLFFTGGYVGIPVAIADRATPRVVYVPDLQPGLALRFMMRKATHVAVTSEASTSYYGDTSRVRVVGYPVRAEMRNRSKEAARTKLGIGSDGPLVLFFGGSRGARSINDAVLSNLPELLSLAQVAHITGTLDWSRVSTSIRNTSSDLTRTYHAFEYLHEEMPDMLAAADLVVSRAGAATLGEYPAFGLPSILVPYPHAWKYQQVNANHLVERGAAVIIQDEQLDSELVPHVKSLIENPDRLRQMRQAVRKLDRPDAASRVARLIEAAPKGGAIDRG